VYFMETRSATVWLSVARTTCIRPDVDQRSLATTRKGWAQVRAGMGELLPVDRVSAALFAICRGLAFNLSSGIPSKY